MEFDFSIAFVGCGNMGGAILEGVLAAGDCNAKDILVIERSPSRIEAWSARGVTVSERDEDACRAACIVLAVKPQDFPAAAEGMGRLPASTLVISVMAGLSSSNIQSALGEHARVIRTMPNTPCQIGSGITAISSGAGSTPEDLEFARQLLGTVGKVVEVDESHMYAVTATSGSGPAYAFLLAEAWINGAVEAGLDPEVARELVHATLEGAAALLTEHKDAKALRAAVTSKGGTTAAAIEKLEDHGIHAAMRNAIEAATNRGRELDSEVPS